MELSTVTKEIKTVKPPLKWAGGKPWLVPYLRPIWEDHHKRKLVEPLCGGLAVTLGFLPAKGLLNDINVHLQNFYGWIKAGLKISLEMENDQQLNYLYRDRFNRRLSSAILTGA